jgi:hypothetical protein
MKHILLTLSILLSISSFAANKKEAPPMPDEQKTRRSHNINQHVAVSVTLAEFYCEKHTWPKDLEEFKSYTPEKPVPMPVQLEWEFITQPQATFEFGEQIILYTPPGTKPGEISVKSTNSFPKCDGNTIKPQVNLLFGKEKT